MEGHDVLQVTLERLGPYDRARGSADQFRRDSNPIACPKHRPFDNRVDLQLPRDGGRGLRGRSVLHDRTWRDHAQSAGRRQVGNELLGHPVRKVLLFGIAGQVLEWQNRNGSNLAWSAGRPPRESSNDAPSDESGERRDEDAGHPSPQLTRNIGRRWRLRAGPGNRVAGMLEFADHVARGLKSLVGILGEASAHHVVDSRRHLRLKTKTPAGGSCSRTAARTSATVSPSNAGRPVSISKATAPNENRSLRASTS